MLLDFKKYHTLNEFDLAWRFTDNPHSLGQITVLDEKLNLAIWKALEDDSLIGNYSLNEDSLVNFEIKHFENEYDLMAARLKELKDQNDNVILTWASGQLIETSLENFANNFNDFFYPSSDDIFVINLQKKWLAYISHFEVFQWGEIKASHHLTSAIGNGG